MADSIVFDEDLLAAAEADTDTYTEDIEIPPTTKVVASDAPGGGDLPNDIENRRRRKRLVERAADQQMDHAKAAQNPKAYRNGIIRRLNALWDSWPPELVASIGDSDLVISLASQDERPRNRRPAGSGVCAVCGGTGVYVWGDREYQREQCPNGCPKKETA